MHNALRLSRLYLAGLAVFLYAVPDAQAQVWYKGNLHTHSTTSDGDSAPITVARWYRDNNYDFLVLSDHNQYNSIASIQTTLDNENALTGHKRLLLIPGEEISDLYGSKKVHLGGINTTGLVGAQGGSSVANVIQRCTDAIKLKGGMPIINHPNLSGSSFPSSDVFAVKNLKFLELYNAHPSANNGGGNGLPAMGDYWDDLLGRPRQIWGVATDDAHHFQTWGSDKANPGRAWVTVNAPSLTAANIVSSLSLGKFYASTGVVYSNVTTANNVLSIALSGAGPFTTTFTGKGGAVLKTDTTMNPSYTLPTAGQLFVRAKTNASYGSAWTQPLFDKSYIVDNADAGFSASANWVIGTSAADKYKTNYHYRSTLSGSPDRASFTVGTAGTGDFDISAWWAVGTAGNRNPEAHYFLPDGREVIVDQRYNGGKWNYLGTVRFNAEGDHTVQLAAGGPAGYACIADAVMMYGPK
ncbi:MAG: hypothetical protein ACR2IE_13835 [Candidatus Sumerlaeaceae bacterium]